MHKNRPFTVIAINPGWRYLGIAIYDCAGLKEWRLKNMSGTGMEAKMNKVNAVLSDFIDRYAPTLLAIKKLDPARSSPNLKIIASRIEATCRRNGMKVCSYSIRELEGLISPDCRMNKKDLSELLTSEYPILSHELAREQRNRQPYYLRLFEAVALGHVCYRKFLNNCWHGAED